jgi:hypothetical protein
MTFEKSDPNATLEEHKKRCLKVLGDAHPGEVLNIEKLAKRFGFSSRNLKLRYIDNDPEFPIEEVGSEGRGYAINVIDAARHMIKRCDEKIYRNTRNSLLNSSGLGVEVSDDSHGTIAELRHKLAISMTLRAEKREDGQWMKREDVKELFSSYNEEMITFLTSERSRCDPNGQLPVDISEAIDADMADLASSLNQRATEFLREYGDTDTQRDRNIGTN